MMIKIRLNQGYIQINRKCINSFVDNDYVYRGNLCNIIKLETGVIVKRKFDTTEPLYYSIYDNVVYISSDIMLFPKHLIKTENDKVLDEFLTYGYVFPPYTLLKHIYKLPNCAYLEIKVNNNNLMVALKYNFTDDKAKNNDNLFNNISNCVKKNEKCSLLFSGGLDSTLISKLFMGQINNYYATGFEFKNCDLIEKEYALSAAKSLNINLSYKSFKFKDLLLLLPEAILYSQNTLNHIQTLLLYKIIKEMPNSDKIILNGQGADAIFGTGAQYRYFCKINDQLNKYKKIIKFDFHNNTTTTYFEPYEFENEKNINSALDLDFYVNLIGDCEITISSWALLAKQCNKEMIFPFFLESNYNYVKKLKWDVRLQTQKNILKKHAAYLKIPQSIINRKKASFGPISEEWGKYLIPLISLCEEFINISHSILTENKYRYNLWNLVNYAIWKKIFIDKLSINEIQQNMEELLNYDKKY